MRKEPLFQLRPGIDFVAHLRCPALDLLQIGLKHFVDQPFLALKVVIELPLPRSGSFDDFIGARGASALLVKQVGSRANDPHPGIGASDKSGFHNFLSLYSQVQLSLCPHPGRTASKPAICTCIPFLAPLLSSCFTPVSATFCRSPEMLRLPSVKIVPVRSERG